MPKATPIRLGTAKLRRAFECSTRHFVCSSCQSDGNRVQAIGWACSSREILIASIDESGVYLNRDNAVMAAQRARPHSENRVMERSPLNFPFDGVGSVGDGGPNGTRTCDLTLIRGAL